MGSTTQLLCDLGLGSSNPSVAGFVYRFQITDAASGCGSAFLDYNGDGVVNPDDIGDYITDYFTRPHPAGPGGYASPCPNAPDMPGSSPNAYRNYGYKTDFDKSTGCGEPNSDDLGDWITQYFLGCA